MSSTFTERLGQEFVITAELEPPRSADPASVYRQAKDVKPYVHAVNISDAPMANLRMSPVALAHLVQAYFGLETIIHLTCRDRNVLALQSELLGAAALGIHNVLTLTGDPPTRGDHPGAKGVYEVDVLGLIRLVNCLNQGKSGGRDLDVPTNLTVAAAANPSAKDLAVEVSKFNAKLAAGAHFFQTQPIFSVEDVLRFQAAFGGTPPAPVLYGVLPVRSVKMAKNVAKWCNVPSELIQGLEFEGKAAGLRWTKRLIEDLRELGVDGVHVYPLGKTELMGHFLPLLVAKTTPQEVREAVLAGNERG